MKIKESIEQKPKLCHSISSKDWLLRPGWHKMQMETNAYVDVEAALQFLDLELVEEENHHQFLELLGMIEWTTCLHLYVEQEVDKDVICAMLLQI